MRFSTNPGDILDDKVSTPRGLAIKLVGVEGPRLPGSAEATTQDFVMQNAKAFTAKDPKAFLKTLKLLAKTTDKAPSMKRALSAVLRGIESVIESAGGESGTLRSLGGHPMTHILGETFYTVVPFLYGPYYAKLSVVPVSAELTALTDKTVDLKTTRTVCAKRSKRSFLSTMPVGKSASSWPRTWRKCRSRTPRRSGRKTSALT